MLPQKFDEFSHYRLTVPGHSSQYESTVTIKIKIILMSSLKVSDC